MTRIARAAKEDTENCCRIAQREYDEAFAKAYKETTQRNILFQNEVLKLLTANGLPENAEELAYAAVRKIVAGK